MKHAWILLLALPLAAQDSDRRLEAKEGTNYAYSMPRYGSLDEWKARREHLRKQILAAAGLLPMPYHGAVRSQIFDRIDRQGYSIEKVWVETMPGYYLAGNLYKPRGRAGKFPGIVSPHGHWKRGRLEDSKDGSIPARCINLARQGYVVFAYDMVGYNDTTQTPHVFGGAREDLYNFGPLGLQLWNSIRAVDFVESLPEVDAGRLGATGASGGGTQTFLLTAVDDRIKAAVPVNMISGIMQGGSPCENAPGLRHDTFNVDIGAMTAPRPMLMVAATGDWTKNVPRNEYPAIKGIYTLFDAGPQVEAQQFDAPHNYNRDSREAMYTFFAKHLLGKQAGKVTEEPYQVEKDPGMLVRSNMEKPSNALDLAGVFEQWKWLTRAPMPDRETMRYALSVEVPAKVDGQRTGERVVLSRPGKGDRVTGVYRAGSGTAVLAIGEAAPAGQPSLALEVWKGDGRDTKARHFYTFHRTDAQHRVQDILTGLRWLQTQHPGRVEIRASGDAAVWAQFAAAVAGGDIRLQADVGRFQGNDDEMVKKFFVPGIQRVGGLAAALELNSGIK